MTSDYALGGKPSPIQSFCSLDRSRPIPVKLSITFQRNIHYESSGLCDDMAQTHLDAIISLCCCFPAVLPLFFIYPESYVWSFIGKMNYDWPYIPHFPAHHHGFQSFSQWLSKLWVNSFTNQLAIRCHPNLAFILQPPTCHLYYVRAAFPSPGLPSQAQEHQKPHANNQPAWQRTSWKKRIIPETTAPRNRTATQLHGYNNWGQHVPLDPRYRPWLIKVIFSLTAPEERQHSEPGEFLRQKERPDHKDAECTLGIQTPWPPAPLNSHVRDLGQVSYSLHDSFSICKLGYQQHPPHRVANLYKMHRNCLTE